MRRLLRFLLPVGVLGMLTFASPAAADQDPLHPHLDRDAGQSKAAPHPGVVHTPNFNLVFNSQNPQNMTNSDLAFWGNRAYQGDYGGLRVFNISNPAAPQLLGDFRCLGPQNDPIVWQNRLAFLAVDAVMESEECGATVVPLVQEEDPFRLRRERGWEGVRIVDVSDPANMRQVAAVYTHCGAHTITLWPRDARNLLIYVSSYPLTPGPTCGTHAPAQGRSATHDVIQVIHVPVDNPAAARVIAEPQIVYPGDPDGVMVWGAHGLPSPPFEPAARACHDISVFVELRLAAAACAEQAQLWRVGPDGIPDTQNPIWVYDEPTDTDGPGGGDVAVDFWHSATMSWDGRIANFIDESFGDGCPPVTDINDPPAGQVGPADTGRSFFVAARTGAKLSHFMIPRPEEDPCYNSAHLGNVATSIGRYFNVNAWYMGGADVIDFTNPRRPFELAFWDFLPAGATGSDNWSHYWYENTMGDNNGMWTYGTDGVHSPATGRGFEVFRLTSRVQDVGLRRLNPQTQENRVTCRIAARGALRARERTTLTLRVRAAGGPEILPEPLQRLRVVVRGPGIRVRTVTNRNGVARIRGITPTRRGVLRVNVPSVPNLVGCSARRNIAAARPARVGVPGARLTGSRG